MAKSPYSNFKPMKGNIAYATHAEYGEQLWSLQKCHQDKQCQCTKVELKGKLAYAPVTNTDNRGHWISKQYMEMTPEQRRKPNLSNI